MGRFRFMKLLGEFYSKGGTEEFLKLVNRAVEVAQKMIKPFETEAEKRECLEIAKDLPEWFNEAGLKAIERDLGNEETYLAVENGNVLGFITIKPINDKALEILWMAVRREYRREGIGSALLKFVESLARKRGFEILVVKTSGDLSYRPYDETRRFYEKNGFVSVALIDPYPEWGEEALIYVKCLASSSL